MYSVKFVLSLCIYLIYNEIQVHMFESANVVH